MSSRPRRFRIWAKPINGYLEAFSGPFGVAMAEYLTGALFSDPKTFDHCVFEQFTGLLDKEGREIYEGDILSLETHDVWQGKRIRRPFRGTVWYNADEACYGVGRARVGSGDPQIVAARLDHGSSCNHQVIGNIHENPDLLS